ncbi:MAG TPA: cell division protein SepF [Actinomycetota bacterium]|nr:cell division protein SepF [Actinomycetota bacterium]
MPGMWRKTMKYLGLVEEDEFDDMETAGPRSEGESRFARPHPVQNDEVSAVRTMRREDVATADHGEAIVRTIPQSRHAGGSIHRAEPKRFNEARELGERFNDGVPVIMNLQGTDDAIARRLVDFASGLVFAHDGKIELVANRVYLLTPANVEVSAEERERLREGGFYNQL